MTLKIHPWATSAEITVGAAESIVVETEGIAKVYRIVGYPNVPDSKSLVGTVDNELTVFGPYASGATIVIETNHEPALYEVGADPTIDSFAPELQLGATGAQGEAVELRGGTSTTATNAGGAAALTGGTPGATGAGGAANVTGGPGGSTSGAGGAASLAGGAATAGNSAGGAANLTGGEGSGTGNGGAAAVAGGVSGAGATGNGGAASVAGGAAASTNGAGGAASVTGGAGSGTGAGGAASVVAGASGAGATGNGGVASLEAGDAASTNGNGGNARVIAGAKAGTGLDGMVKLEGVQVGLQGAPTAKTVAVTLTAAELLTGLITGTHAAGADQAYTLPTGTLLDAAVQMSVGEYFDWTLINLSAAAADTVTVTAGADHTVVGVMVVQSVHATTGGLYGSSATFRSRKTAANTFVTYRI